LPITTVVGDEDDVDQRDTVILALIIEANVA
jgi:hypothetical protein